MLTCDMLLFHMSLVLGLDGGGGGDAASVIQQVGAESQGKKRGGLGHKRRAHALCLRRLPVLYYQGSCYPDAACRRQGSSPLIEMLGHNNVLIERYC